MQDVNKVIDRSFPVEELVVSVDSFFSAVKVFHVLSLLRYYRSNRPVNTGVQNTPTLCQTVLTVISPSSTEFIRKVKNLPTK